MGKNWWILPAAILAYIGYKKYALSQSFNVFFKGIDFKNYQLLNPVVNIIVQVNNPTFTTAEIQNIKGDLLLDNQLMGSVRGITPMILQNGANIIAIPVVLNYGGISSLVTNYQKMQGVNLNFKGSITVDYITLPLDFSYTL